MPRVSARGTRHCAKRNCNYRTMASQAFCTQCPRAHRPSPPLPPPPPPILPDFRCAFRGTPFTRCSLISPLLAKRPHAVWFRGKEAGSYALRPQSAIIVRHTHAQNSFVKVDRPLLWVLLDFWNNLECSGKDAKSKKSSCRLYRFGPPFSPRGRAWTQPDCTTKLFA